MTFDKLNIDDFKDEIFTSQTGAMVSMVAGVKFTLGENVVNHLGITREDLGKTGKSKLRIKTNVNKHQMLIMLSKDTVGMTLGGKLNKVEIYCASTCKKLLKLINRELAGSGTVGFGSIELDETPEGIPYVLVDIDSYTANAGVFVDTDETDEIE